MDNLSLIVQNRKRPAGRGGTSTTTVQTNVCFVDKDSAEQFIKDATAANTDANVSYEIGSLPVYASYDEFSSKRHAETLAKIVKKISPEELANLLSQSGASKEQIAKLLPAKTA